MKRIFSALFLLTLSVGVGCGGDDDDAGNNTGGSSSAGTASAAGEPATTGGTSNGNVGCDPAEATACQNDTDCPFVVDGTARLTAGECGKGCLGKEETCARDCVLEMLEMTDECAGCYADTVNCTIKNCAALCIADTEAAKCKECQIEKGCRESFNDCSGLPE